MSDDVMMPTPPTPEEQAAEQAAREKAAAEALAAALAAIAAANADAKPIDLPPVDIVPAPKGGFGPTFWAELEAARVATLPFVVHPDSVMFSPDISSEDRAKVLAVIQAHDPTAPPPLPPLSNLSDRQFGEGLWREGLITFDDYLAFIGPGTVPAPLLAIINTLPDDDTGAPTPRKTALGLVTGAQTYEFANPLVDLVRQKLEWTVDKLRDRWATWATL